jgi:hypothetical protein
LGRIFEYPHDRGVPVIQRELTGAERGPDARDVARKDEGVATQTEKKSVVIADGAGRYSRGQGLEIRRHEPRIL